MRNYNNLTMDDACAKISARPSILKIVVKTLDESLLIRPWVEHHSRIVSPEDIIILDNGSTCPEVLAYYAEICNDAIIYRFKGACDNVHHVRLFPALYSALRSSSKFWCLIDTDEFLYFHSRNGMISNKDIPLLLSDVSPSSFFPGIWIHNYPGSAQHFFMPTDDASSILWGKPLIGVDVAIKGFLIHNVHLYIECGSVPIQYGLFVAHLTRYDPQQRILANLRKLKSYGTLQSLDLSEALRITPVTGQKIHGWNFIEEIRQLLKIIDQGGWPVVATTPPGCIHIREDGALGFGDDHVRASLEGLSLTYPEYCRRIFHEYHTAAR